jgi:hypothetical protein
MAAMNIRPEFKVHMLNASGKAKAENLALHFSQLLDVVESSGVTGRALALVKTNLETACFNAKRGIAELPENQE